jgi:hypothetical protein
MLFALCENPLSPAQPSKKWTKAAIIATSMILRYSSQTLARI